MTVRSELCWKDNKEQLLAEAKSEILRREYMVDLAENHIRVLKGQTESHELEIGRTLAGYDLSGREHDLLHEELADRDRALRDSRSTNFHEM